MIIDSVREYLKGCPYLAGGRININCLGEASVCYSIDNVSAEPVIKKYCDGGTLRQFVFVLALRDAYDENVLNNLKSAQFFEQVEAWISEQNRAGMLPQTEDERIKPLSIEVTKSGCLSESHLSDGRWQMELRIIYRQDY